MRVLENQSPNAAHRREATERTEQATPRIDAAGDLVDRPPREGGYRRPVKRGANDTSGVERTPDQHGGEVQAERQVGELSNDDLPGLT